MIKYNYEVSVNENRAKLNKDIFLFRGNRNIHYYFSIKGARFAFEKEGDLIENANAIYAAVTVIKPNGVEVANAIAPVENGLIHLKVTEDLIDEEVEIGDFDLVFDLFDDSDGAVTIPKIKGQFHVQERPCTTSIGTLSGNVNVVNQAVVDLAIATQENEQLIVVDDDGKYVKTTWVKGDKISIERLNKIEEGIEKNSTQYKDIAKKIEQGGTGDGKGLTQIQITALDNMFKVCAYDSNKNVNSAYNAFKTAFNISSGGGTVDPEPVEKTKYTITNNLTDITTNNTTSEIEEGSTYKAILSTSVNYAIKTITIIMGGKDVTSIVYADGVINIGSVTGNIVITATAESIKVTPESLGFETLFEYDDVYNKDAVVAKYGTNGLVTYNYTGAVTVACYYNSVNNTSPAPNMNNVFDGRAYGSITYMTNGDGTKSGGVKKLKSDLITSYGYKTGKTPKCYGCYTTGTNSGKIQIFANQYKPIDVETPSVDTHVRILIIKGTSITAEQLCTIFGI